MAGGPERRQHRRERGVDRHADDIGARHHHVADPDFMQSEHILEHGPLLRTEIVGDRRVVERVFDIVADGGSAETEQSPQTFENGAALLAGTSLDRGGFVGFPLRRAH